MKTLNNGFCILLIIYLFVPLCLMAQNKEITITTSSKEALDFLLKGRDKLENFEEADAAALFEKAIQKDPEFAMAYLYRSQSGGGFNVFRQNLDKAAGLISKVSEGEKYEILYFQALANGDGLKRKEYLDRLLKLFPSDKRVQGLAGIYYYSINDFNNALKHFTKSTELDNKYPPSFNMVGYCQSALNNFKEAEKSFQVYIKLSPKSPNGHDSYAELLLKMGKYDESIVQYKKALELDATFSFSLIGMGNNYIFKGDYEAARKYYQDYFNKTPSSSGKLIAIYWKAISFIYEGKIEKAISIFDEYRAMAEKENQMTNAIMAYANQGFIFSESGNPAEGYKYFGKAFDLIEKTNLQETVKANFNTYSMMWNYYTLTAKGELDKAKAEAEKCKQKVESRKNPDEEMFLNSIFAFFEIRKGNYDKAIEYFAKADTEDPLNWYYNGVACDKKGDKKNAIKLFEKVAKWNVNSLNLALVRNRATVELKK